MESTAEPSNSSARKCLICGTKTMSCHLGVDACRACTVFYRRARTHKPYACRSNTRRCAVDAEGGIACKRCRFDRFERVLNESGAMGSSEQEPSPTSSLPERLADSRSSPPTSSPLEEASPSLERLLQTPSMSSAFSPVPPSGRRERTLLEKCKLHYRLLCSMRRTCELASRPKAPHPMQMNERDSPIYPATFTVLEAAAKISIAAILEFAEHMFPEFAGLSRSERWHLAVNFFYRFQAFDSCYRGEKRFPHDHAKSFGSYTTYFAHEIIDDFFSDVPAGTMEEKSMDESKKFLHDILDRLVPPGRAAIRRATPDHDEFHAVLVILFWFTDGMLVRDEIVQTGERYRSAILQELHSYYREELGVSDYATRVGELFMLILHFERSKDIKEHFEICRLLGVFTDDTFVYQLQKEELSIDQ